MKISGEFKIVKAMVSQYIVMIWKEHLMTCYLRYYRSLILFHAIAPCLNRM